MLKKCWVTYLPQASAGLPEVRTASTAVRTAVSDPREPGGDSALPPAVEPVVVEVVVPLLAVVVRSAAVDVGLDVSPPPPQPARPTTRIARPSATASA